MKRLKMGTLEGFGFKIYRLREAKETQEFVIFDISGDKINYYSKTRCTSMLSNELLNKGIDIKEFIREDHKLGVRDKISSKEINIYLSSLINGELELLDNICFRPIDQKIFSYNGKKYFNTYIQPITMSVQNYLLENKPTYEETMVKCSFTYKLLKNLHGNDDLAIKNTLYKLAHKIQRPWVKSQDCFVFYPGEGAGKGIFYKYIISGIFGKYAKKVLMNRLKGDFNGFMEEALFLVFEEGKRDLELVETLKELITEGEIFINEKQKVAEMKEIFSICAIFSNHMNPADLGKRRGSYHQCNSLGKTIQESQEVGAEICENIPNELNDLLYYLHNIEVEDQKAMMPFNTLAKVQVNDLNKNAIELFYDYLIQFPNIEEGFEDLHKMRYGTKFNFPKEKVKEIDYISKDLFKDAYNNFCTSEGLKNNIIRHNKDIVQLWALLKIPVESHKRITIVDNITYKQRKLDHIKLEDINSTIVEGYKQNENN